MILSRRRMCAALGAAAFASSGTVFATPLLSDTSTLLGRARAALELHSWRGIQRDALGLVDFSAASNLPRFTIVDLITGGQTSFLVAHGRGSDPGHTGWLHRFSNEVGSEASSEGAYLTGDLYNGHHGRSRRLIGLEPSNSNAYERGLVIHGASYVSRSLAGSDGKIGRSEGCLAVSPGDCATVLRLLGPGRLIYASKA